MVDTWLFIYGCIVLLLGAAGWVYTVYEVSHYRTGKK